MTPSTAQLDSGSKPAESRVERKRRATRERIIQESERLMRSRPMAEISIADITSAADVGHGTFYLHFKSKYEVLIPITRGIALRWDRAIQKSISDIDDPAEVVGLSARYMGRAILADPLWGWLLKHSGMPMDDIGSAVGRFASRDFGRGLLSGRFVVPTLAVANSFLIGGFVSSLLACFDAEDSDAAIDQIAELLLRTLGVATQEAARIAHQHLPPLAITNGEHA